MVESSSSSTDPTEPLYQVKLLSALRSGDPALIHPFLAEIGKDRRKSNENDTTTNLDTGAAALHLAVRCGSADTVALLLSHRAISPNGVHPPGSGTTPLHLAASLGRVDIVNLLLEQDSINDTLRDVQGRSVKDVARGKEVIRALQDSHSFLNASYRSLLRSYILSSFTTPPASPLLHLLESPRIRFVNLSYLDDDSSTSLLHEAARRRDLRLIELAVRAGADVFVRDRRGKMAHEGRDEKVKVFLRQFANHDTTLIDQPVSEPPTLKGYLNKYTNVAKGYNTRWFVLKAGVLSYYRHQEDESIASRGSISMKTAILKHSIPSSLSPSPPQLHSLSQSTTFSSSSTSHLPTPPTRSQSQAVIIPLPGPGHRDGYGHGHGHGQYPMTSPPPSDKEKLRFEVHSTPTVRGHQPQKWYMKANHPVEAARWAQAIARSIDWARREGGGGGGTDVEGQSGKNNGVGVGGGSLSVNSGLGSQGGKRKSEESEKSVTVSLQSTFSQRATATAGTLLRRGRRRLDRAPLSDRELVGESMRARFREDAGGDVLDVSSSVGMSVKDGDGENGSDGDGDGDGDGVKSGGEGGGGGYDEDGETPDDSSAAESRGEIRPPHEAAFELQANSVAAQMELTMQLLANLSPAARDGVEESSKSSSSKWSSSPVDVGSGVSGSALWVSSVEPGSASVSGRASSSSSSSLRRQAPLKGQANEPQEGQVPTSSQALHGLRMSLSTAHSLLMEYTGMVREREAYWRRALEKERKRQRVWEESLATVVREGETLERELRARSRKRGSRFFDVGGAATGESVGGMSSKGRRASALGRMMEEVGQARVEGSFFPEQKVKVKEKPLPELEVEVEKPGDGPMDEVMDMDQGTVPAVPPVPPKSPNTTPVLRRTSVLRRSPPSVDDDDDGDDGEGNMVGVVDTDEEDEFFDAIEYGTLPNLVVPQELTSPSTLHAVPSLPSMFDYAVYEGYKNLRTRLNLNEERPPTSLWSVLKHSIGKDLTRISFPVFFNEPTSMLQRMAEDMEFSECLDAAAREKDPLKRIAFVAAFAMSNYSSTIGRIAKPFNPMLSETFEYVRFDREYRYMSEQVSHHPPISACWAESPSWHYYGEVDAQNKFMGKSFEIRPTGVAHAELLIPEERGLGYPKAPGKAGKGKVVEHYSWKKVTTNVSGFILGSPTIDHYGDMIVTNHRTNDRCILTFKPRGWRGKDAFEIAGQVIDSSGRVAFDIAGRWNSQLIARQPGGGTLNPDISISGSSPVSPLSVSKPFVLWKNSEKPAGSPFNLTPFAITLNDCPKDTLKPYLCPTDCRLRPDQRAFELGKYEYANELKGMQEEMQRATRRARDEGRMKAHRPRWFRAETDGDTGERVWTPSRVGEVLEYWVERESVWKAAVHGKEDGRREWKDVDPIFIEEPGKC